MMDYRRAFQEQVAQHKEELQLFINGLELHPPLFLDACAEPLDTSVWQEVDCLKCANCCRTMSPVYITQDIKRLATHLRLSVSLFKEKWLYKNEFGEWMNRNQPCQFLDLETNKCSVYAVRPADCAGFPHLTKKKMVEYLHVHRQNLSYCPATLFFLQKLQRYVETKTASETNEAE